jgi:hypothetical protein
VFVLSLRHRVRDFEAWKAVFDERLDARLKGKVTGHRLTRSAEDPNGRVGTSRHHVDEIRVSYGSEGMGRTPSVSSLAHL